MSNTSDAELLREYARQKSEGAFGEIVRRYANPVYSAACRQTENAEAARDVAQMVFADLARKASRLGEETVLAGWLYRGVRLQSLEFRRKDARRQRRERESMEPCENSSATDGDWAAVRPLLDDAMGSLADKDRDALLLRFFNNESFASVGGAMGISEDAAQKRVSRALGRLRDFLARRGITTSEAALSATLTANAVQTAPGGIASWWVSGALAGARLSSPSFLSFFPMKAAFLIAALAGSVVVLTISDVHSKRRVAELQASLQAQAGELAAARGRIEQLELRGAAVSENDARVREIARLRARIDRLRSDLEAEKARQAHLTQQSAERQAPTNDIAIPAQITIEAEFLTAPTQGLRGTATGLMTYDEAAAMVSSVTNTPDVNVIFQPRVTTLCGRQAHIGSVDAVPTDNGTTNIGLSLDVVPECSTNSETVSLQLSVNGTRLGEQSAIEHMGTNTVVDVPDGNALVLTMTVPGAGPWFGGDPTNSEANRTLIMVLTPTMIDAAGNRLHPIPTNEPPQTVTANPSGVFPVSETGPNP